jgi:outer membrane protein, heavy metal efflux system
LKPVAGRHNAKPLRNARDFGTRRSAIVVLLVLALAGCVDYQPAPLHPEQSAAQFAARRLDSPQLLEAVGHLLPQMTIAPPQWDRAQLLAVALVQNPQLGVARAQTQAALAHEITAAQWPNPDLTLQSEYARHDPHPWLYGFALSGLVIPGERRRLETQISRLDTGNARLQLMDQTWLVRHALVAALTDLESARRRLLLLDRLAQDQDRLLGIEKQRVNAGEDPPSELVVAQQTRIDIDLQQAQLRATAQSAQDAAAKVLGMPPPALDAIAITWPDWGDPPAADDDKLGAVREQALLSRADLGAAIGEYAVAESKLKLAIARQYPQFEFEPGYYWDHGIAKFPFDVGFSVPFNGNRGEIAEAQAARDLAGQRMLALQGDIQGAIAAAERAERIARASSEAAEQQLRSVRQQEQRADLAVRLGASGMQDQLVAQILSTRAELELAQMRAQLQAARNELEDALHAPLSGPELALVTSFSTTGAGR